MGASTDYRVYKYDLGKEKVKKLFEADCQSDAYENGHSYSGTIGMLRTVGKWLDLNLDGYAAEAYIDEHHQKWDAAMAVSGTLKGIKYWWIGGWCSS
jgi:hypothetical protein